MTEQWVHTDEAEDVAGSIRQVLQCFSQTQQDGQAWKWAALALHAALQGASVCHLVTTAAPIGAVTEENARKWLNYFEQSRSAPSTLPPKTYLMSFPDLIRAIMKPNSAGDRSNTLGVEINVDEFKWLERFHADIRNQFVHFSPMGWSLEVTGIKDISILISRIVLQIQNFGWAFRHKDAEWNDSLISNLKLLSKQF